MPDAIYGRILDGLGDELTYAFGGSTVITTSGKYRSVDGLILPDRVDLLFSDTPFLWERDRLIIEQYAERIRGVVHRSLAREESVLVVVYSVYHSD
jgi:hypothetical protein